MSGRTRVVHCRKDRFDEYIGRPSLFGNPFVLKGEAQRLAVLEQYRVWFLERVARDPAFAAAVKALQGKVLGCFCAPKPCHGHVIAAWCDGEMVEDRTGPS